MKAMKNGNKIYTIKFSKLAEKDKIELKNSGLDKTCKNILDLMQINSLCYPPTYEKLSGDLSGLYSRRINRQHRIIYEISSSFATRPYMIGIPKDLGSPYSIDG